MDLGGSVVLITGGASGLGLVTGRRLAASGAHVVVADIDEPAARRAANELGGRAVALDVGDLDAWGAVIDDLSATEGRLDVAFLNAGVGGAGPDITTFDLEQYRRAVRVNLDGVIFGLRSVVPIMQDGGSIIATASLGGLTPMPMDPVYSATKHAVVALMRSVAPSLEERGITANALCPGYADTPLVTEEAREKIDGEGLPLIDPERVADAVVAILTKGGTGEAWFVQVGREPAPYAFRGVPGPRPL
jgi:NAD(P)-dependent dehydrogenase (short-subunit alcohol dehydrogenase family)